MIPKNYRFIRSMNGEHESKCVLCEDCSNHREVVLKIIEKNKFSKSQFELTKSIMRSFIGCSSIINIEKAFTTDQSYIYVMEPGAEDLNSYINNKGPLSENQARTYFYYIALAIQSLHAKNIIHHDIKLENIMLMRDGKVKLIDFELCERVPANKRSFAKRGTMKYMAPEIMCSRSHSANVDVWSFGVTIYTALANKFPFQGDSDYTYLENMISSQPDMNALEEKNISKRLINLIEKMLQKNPEKRISIDEIVEFQWRLT